ncbi:MAG: hypothetical protein WDM78_22100 [Puia sp.]
MSDRRITILSTASLPLERIKNIPASMDVQVIPFIEIIQRPGAELIPIISTYGSEKLNVVFTSAHAGKVCIRVVETKTRLDNLLYPE